jgi:Rrf2 family protein
MRISAKADYAVRAALELAATEDGGPLKGERIAQRQGVPLKFLENILIDLRNAGIVRTQRGPEGGYWLAKPAKEVKVGDIIRAVEGPLASVRGEAPEDVDYTGAAEGLRTVWVALRANLRAVLDQVTLEQVASGELPASLRKAAESPGAWARR